MDDYKHRMMLKWGGYSAGAGSLIVLGLQKQQENNFANQAVRYNRSIFNFFFTILMIYPF
jgi:hypothetical protein